MTGSAGSPRPGKVIADLAAAVALGGDCLADVAVLREQSKLAGPVASDAVVSGWLGLGQASARPWLPP